MTGWITHLIAFLAGVGVGGLWMANRRRSSGAGHAQRQSEKALRRLYTGCPEFFDEIRAELGKAEFRDVREFAIVESSQVTFVSDDVKLVYYEDELPDLKKIASELEEYGFVDEVTRGKTPLYRMRDSFLTALGSL